MQRLRRDVIWNVIAALIAVLGLGMIVRSTVDLTAAFPLKALAGVLAVGVVVVPAAERRHPFDRFGAANQVTLARATLVALLAAAVGEAPARGLGWAIVTIATTAAVLDAFDGWLARRSRLASVFGARFDMEVDALLILVLSILAWRSGRVGVWVLAAGALRYVFVTAGWLWPWMDKPLPPSVRRQTICVVQIVALIVALSPPVPSDMAAGMTAVALVALVASFVIDTAWLWHAGRRAHALPRAPVG